MSYFVEREREKERERRREKKPGQEMGRHSIEPTLLTVLKLR